MKLLKSNSNLFPSVFSDLFEMDKFFDGFPAWDIETWIPASNIREEEKSYEIELAVPGMKKENITLEIEGHVLTVSGKNQEAKKEEKKTFLRREYQSNTFTRSFSLPDDANEDKITSHYEDGMLKISIEKKNTALKTPKRAIAIS